MDALYLRGFWVSSFLRAGVGACLKAFSSVGDTVVECVVLGLSERFFMFQLNKLCEVLDLSDKMVRRYIEIPWTSSVVCHLSLDWKGLVSITWWDRRDIEKNYRDPIWQILEKNWVLTSTLKSPSVLWILDLSKLHWTE